MREGKKRREIGRKTRNHVEIRRWFASAVAEGKFFRATSPDRFEYTGESEWPTTVSLRAACNEFITYTGIGVTVPEFGYYWRKVLGAGAGKSRSFTLTNERGRVMWYGSRTMHALPQRRQAFA